MAAVFAGGEYKKAVCVPSTRAWLGPRGGDILLRMRRFSAIGAVAIGFLPGVLSGAQPAPATAYEPDAIAAVPGLESANPGLAAQSRAGAFCTPLGCAGAPPSPWGEAAGFAAAALAAGWLARRRPLIRP
jgi:MYXO-CTERM domain-containing protein